jgi:hypothetical protein
MKNTTLPIGNISEEFQKEVGKTYPSMDKLSPLGKY